MPSDKGILARALAGGVARGAGALRKAEELKLSEFQKFQGMQEKFAWGDEVARRARDENIRRFGQELGGKKELAGIQSQYRREEFVGQLTATEQRKRQNVADQVSAEMSAFGASEDEIKEATGWAQAGISRDLIRGTAGKPLSASQAKELAETIDTLYPDLEEEERTQKFKEMESRITSGTFGVSKKREALGVARGATQDLARRQEIVNSATSGLVKTITSNPEQALTEFKALAKGQPELAQLVLDSLKEKGNIYGPLLKSMSREVRAAKPKQEMLGRPSPVIPVPGKRTPGAPPREAGVLGDIMKGGFIGRYNGRGTI